METDPTRVPTQAEVIGEILALESEDAKRMDFDLDSVPGPPATEAQIAAAEQSRGRAFPARYREFLKLHDGWKSFAWGMSLYSTAELTGDAYSRGYLDEMDDDDDEPIPPRVADALVIGASENDASLLLITEAGEILEWLYEEKIAHRDFDALLADHLCALRDIRDEALATERAITASWDPKRRAKQEAKLAKQLRGVLAKAKPVARVAPPKPAAKRPPAVTVRSLVVRRDKKIVAEVTQHLVLYLGAYPAKSEVLAASRAFQDRYPVDGKWSWAKASDMFPHQGKADDETLAAALRIEHGEYGLRFQVDLPRQGGPKKYILNVIGVPPTEDGDELPRASFCEVIVPADESPERLFALARDLVAILPVRSGHGGYAAYIWDNDSKADPLPDIFAWCRRLFGIEIGSVDGWLPGALSRLRGASWLTILGPAFTTELERAKRLRFSRGVAIARSERGAILRAGATPPLGDVARGEFPTAIAEVERAIAPLLIRGYDARSWMVFGGRHFTTQADDLLPMRSHHATASYLARFLDPAGWRAPTPRERAEQMLRTLCKAHHRPDLWKEWQAEAKSYIPQFSTLLRLLFNATTGHTAAAESVAALEFVVQFEEAPPQALSNLLYGYNARKAHAKALAFMPTALARGQDDPTIFHNAACIFANNRKFADAMKCVEAAKRHDYKGMDKIRDDDDLVILHGKPAWRRVFGEPP